MLLFFLRPMMDAILAGRKTQTLRARRLRLRPGASLSLNGRVRAVVLFCDQVTPDDLTEDDARLEGFRSLDELRQALRMLDLLDRQLLTRIRFRLDHPTV